MVGCNNSAFSGKLESSYSLSRLIRRGADPQGSDLEPATFRTNVTMRGLTPPMGMRAWQSLPGPGKPAKARSPDAGGLFLEYFGVRIRV